MHGLIGNCGLQRILPEVVKFIDSAACEFLEIDHNFISTR